MSTDHQNFGKALAKALDDDFKAAINDPRNAILHKVSLGQMTHAEADAWARDNDQPPFVGTPDPSQFDPMADPDWSLAMATAWILWRTPDDVRKVWDKFVSGCTYWHQIGGLDAYPLTLQNLENPPKAAPVGFEPRHREVSAPKEVISDAVYWQGVPESLGRRVPLVAPEEAKRLLLAALREGSALQARHGVMADPIQRHVWGGLSPFDEGRGPHDAVFDLGRVLRLSRVRVERDAVQSLWRGQTQEVEPRAYASSPTASAIGAAGRAAKSTHAQERRSFLSGRGLDPFAANDIATLRRLSDGYQTKHGKPVLRDSQWKNDLRSLRKLQK